MLKFNFMHTSFLTPPFSPSPFIYLRMRYILCTGCCPSTRIILYEILCSEQQRLLTSSQALDHDDALKTILAELDGVPNLGTEELKDARDTAITLELTNRFAHVRGQLDPLSRNNSPHLMIDPHAEEKTLWVQAKRGVLAILRVQPAQDLVESLMRPVTEEDESVWEEILEAEMENEQLRQIPRRQPSAVAADSAYRLEDIRS
jgi:Ras GTPase-activating-like protein IQGAP2/3